MAGKTAFSRNGKLGALMREAMETDVERAAHGRKGQQRLRDKFERELDPQGKLRASNPARLEKLIAKRVTLHMSDLGKASGAARRRKETAPRHEPIRVALYDCRGCADEQGRPTVTDAIVRPCLAHLLKLAPPEDPWGETAKWLYRFCDVLLMEKKLDRLEHSLAAAS